MSTFFSRREGTRATQILVPPRVGHFYLPIKEQKLYCLNETAREFVREGVPIGEIDLERRPLLSREGKPVAAADLPLVRCWREGTPQEAVFVLERPGNPTQVLTWSVIPFRGPEGALTAVTAVLVMAQAEPDWKELAGLAHDLRTPLQTVRWLVPVLEAASAPGDAVAVLSRLRGAADRAMAIGQDLLEWCKSPTRGGAARGDRAWLSLPPLLQALLADQALAAQNKGIHLEANLSAVQDVEAYTDGVRLGRLLGNLLSNAIRYTRTGGVQLQTAWREEGAGKRTLLLSVEDTGVGLSLEDQESIFQPFQRGMAGKMDTDSGGSGLGLAVVDRLIHELGLTMEVSSEPGCGSRFELLLPAEILRTR